MDKKYLINVTRSTVIDLRSEDEAEMIANLMVYRDSEETVAGNLVYITTDIKELTNAI